MALKSTQRVTRWEAEEGRLMIPVAEKSSFCLPWVMEMVTPLRKRQNVEMSIPIALSVLLDTGRRRQESLGEDGAASLKVPFRTCVVLSPTQGQC